MNLRYILVLLALLLFCATLAASPLSDEFETKIRQTKSEADGLPIIREYLPKMTELEDLRILQNYWMRADKAASQQYFSELHGKEPKSPVYHYLWLRGSENEYLQLVGGRDLIRESPDFYWGYRIFSSTYAQILLNEQATEEAKATIRDNQKADLALLQNSLKRFPNDAYVLLALFHHYNLEQDYPTAESYLIRLEDPSAIRVNYQYVLDFIAASKRSRAFEVLYPKVLSAAIAKGELPAADSLDSYQQSYLQALTLAEEWTKMQAWFEANPSAKEQDETIGARIAMHIGLKQYDTALNLLEGAMAKELTDVHRVLDDPRYEVLKSLPRWTEVIANAHINWQQGRALRKEKALAKKISKPAPLWELPDKDGNLVRLEDQRGKIVILDFWATWCKPCLKTMPLLDSWLKKNPGEDLRVFSINTWESQAASKDVISYMSKNGYTMSLLMGNNKIPKAYGFTGIPYICVLDKTGRIAYELNGYTQELPELLDFWVEDLRK